MIDIKLEQVLTRQLIDAPLVSSDLVLDPDNLLVPVPVQPPPKFLYALNPVLMCHMSLLLRDLGFTRRWH